MSGNIPLALEDSKVAVIILGNDFDVLGTRSFRPENRAASRSR